MNENIFILELFGGFENSLKTTYEFVFLFTRFIIAANAVNGKNWPPIFVKLPTNGGAINEPKLMQALAIPKQRLLLSSS